MEERLAPLAPVSGSPRPTATTARPRKEAQVQTKEASNTAAQTEFSGRASANPRGIAA